MNELQMKFKTKLGPIYICANEDAITKVSWHGLDVKIVGNNVANKQTRLINEAFAQISEYLEGERKQFDLPLSFNATTFQKSVWIELTKIPFGKTISYTQLAERVNNPKATRAVGSANGKNPLCIIIPCHRVIAKSGKLAGYVGGEYIKKELLNLERK